METSAALVGHWPADRVARWVEAELGLPASVASTFREEGVDGALLVQLDDEMLDDLDVSDPLHRRRIKEGAARLLDDHHSEVRRLARSQAKAAAAPAGARGGVPL